MFRFLLVALVIASSVAAAEPFPKSAPPDEDAWYATLGHSGVVIMDLGEAREAIEKLNPNAIRNLRAREGAFVTDVMSGSAAETSGMLFADIVTHLDGRPLKHAQHMEQIFSAVAPKTTVNAKALRLQIAGNRVLWRQISGKMLALSYYQNCRNACEVAVDEVAEMVSVQHKDYPAAPSETFVGIDLLQSKDGETDLRLLCNYADDDWLFIHKLTLVGREKTTLQFKSKNIIRDNAGGRVWETIWAKLNQSQIELLRDIIVRRKGLVRFHGADYQQDVELSDKMIARMRAVFDLYAMNQSKPDLLIQQKPVELPKPEFRKWSAGEFSVDAKFISADDKNAKLKRKDSGKEISVPLSILSDVDRSYIKEMQ